VSKGEGNPETVRASCRATYILDVDYLAPTP
jgi:hypothetical protein